MSLITAHDSKVWFITGSSIGFGRALVEELLVSGERVVATLRQPEVLAQLVEKYPSSQLLILPLNVTNQAQITGPAVAFVRDVNPVGQGGRIINMGSMGGYRATPAFGHYSAAKFALEGITEALTREMLPAWNIKAIILEPGMFRTEILSSIIQVPLPPAYDPPDSPSVALRRLTSDPTAFIIGDPRKAAHAIMKVAALPDPPLRIQLGTDSLSLVRSTVMQTIKDGEEFEELAHSTDADGVGRTSLSGRSLSDYICGYL